MRTPEKLQALLDLDRTAFLAFRRQSLRNLDILHHVYASTQTKGPRATVTTLLTEMGRAEASALIASLVNVNKHDGRLSESVKAWAALVEDSNDEEAARKLGLLTPLHPAQLNQIAIELIKELG